MSETFNSCLGKVNKLLTRLSVERTTEPKETAQGSSSSKSPQEKTGYYHSRLMKKRKKSRISFATFTLVLIFMILCMLPLLGQHSASAVAADSSSVALHHSASTLLKDLDTNPSTPVDCTLPANISNNSCYGGGDPIGTPSVPGPGAGDYVLGSDCTNHYATADSPTTYNNTMCWNDADFGWGNRDLTCVENQDYSTQLQNFNTDHPGVNFGTGVVLNLSGTPLSNQGPGQQFFNQNSCVDASTCYSNNASHNDDSGQIHDLIGGDDLVCYNNACISGNTSGSSGCGAGVPYDKFGCSAVPNLSGWYYNPTAYNPIGALEQINTNFKVTKPFKVGADSSNTVACNSSNHWSCPIGDAVVLFMDEGQGKLVDPFTSNNPEQVLGTTSTNTATVGYGGSNIPITRSWSYLPTYSVFCTSTGSNWFFPCSDIGYSDTSEGKIDEGTIKTDWLSGDGGVAPGSSGHLAVTYVDDTVSQPNIQALFSMMLGLGYLLLAPVVILIGYQMLWASWTLGRAAAMEAFGRIILSLLAVTISWQLAGMLITLANTVNAAVVFLHVHLPYPITKINGQSLTYILDGESDPLSYRGIVMPISRWGCAMNDFMKILGQKLLTDLSGFIPFVGGLIKLGLGIWDAIDVFKHIGEFIELILSITLATQIFVRLILINYYILTGPVALGCWALPGGAGQRVVAQWFKGFCSLLFVQGIQLFILTTLPLVVPSFPNLPADKFGVVNIFFAMLPRIIVLMAVVQAPKMLGTGATKVIAQAGTVAGGTVAALGAAAYSVV